jgi:hypothetical protein
MAKRLTQNDFIEKLHEIHGNKFDYSDTIYVNARTKVTVSCKVHGHFQILPDNHLRGQGCVKCAQNNHKLIKISDDRLSNLKKIHNDKYVYENLNIIDGQIKILCTTHGTFEQSIYNHERGHGCNLCNIDNRKVVKYRICKCCGLKKEMNEYNSKFRTCNDCVTQNPIVDTKICNKCNTEKSIAEFYKRDDSSIEYRYDCKDCFNTERKPKRKIYRQKNRISISKKEIAYRKARMKTDPFYRAKIDARNVIRKALSEGGYKKSSRTEEILGCSFVEFKEHIESLFLPGMGWKNRSEWHIDHIVPLSFAKSENELLSINNYNNLRPLWIEDNQVKSDEITLETDLYYKLISER